MSTKFFTNRESNSLFQKFVGVFENVEVEQFDALVGYFRSSGYFKLRPHLNNVNKIRILVGINSDELIANHYNNSGLLFDRSTMDETRERFLEDLKSDIQDCNYKKEIEDGIIQFLTDVESQKIELRAHPSKKLHAKIYIFKPNKFNEHNSGEVITGSSNLTEAGLGINNWSRNYEFNVILKDYDDVKFANEEFENLWEESHPILASDIQKVKDKTFIKDGFTVKELYYKLLIEYFGKNVDFDPNAVTDLPKGFIKLNYQLDAVDQGLRLLEKHNGFLLSDVVGLGKTIIAILIAKKYFYSNGFPNHISRTLVVIPPALKEVWDETIEKFSLTSADVVTTGSLHKVLDKSNKYDLIIVDEAHKFRNSNTEIYDNLLKICKEHAGRQRDDETYYQKKVILMSATPLNNRPEDIKNLVFLFQDGKDSTLDIPNLTSFFNEKKTRWEEAKRLPLQTSKPIIEEIYYDIREKVIQPLTIRRTRTDLLSHPIYKDDLIKQGIVFPKVDKPKPLYYELDAELDLLYEETMKLLTPKSKELTFNRYKIISFLKPEFKKDYKDADRTSEQLVYIMRLLLVKRIDSSFIAFRSSLKRFVDAMEVLLSMRDNNKIVIAPKLKNKVIDMMLDGEDDKLFEILVERSTTDPTIKICEKDDFIDGFFEGVEKDLEILKTLYEKWEKVKTDPKYDKFKGYLTHMMDKTRNPQGKVIVFSESKDTTDYITKRLKEDNILGVIDVDASNRKLRINDLRENFDANYQVQKDDFKIVITTEVLAEGVNLHRSNTIVNYDTPWNATRLMQRIGRVNRIGSTAPEVFVYNFFPTSKVENDIELKKKAILKLVAFHNALGEDSQIYSPDEGDIESFGLFEQSPNEERDLNLNYLMELREFREKNEEEYLKIKNLPLKVRVSLENQDIKSTSYCFLKNERKNVFYEIKEDEIKELSFTKMADSLKESLNKKTTSTPENHYKHVEDSINSFQKEIFKDNTISLTADDKKGPQEKGSSELISVYSKASFINEDQRNRMKLALKCIQIHSLPNLTNELFKLSRNIKKSNLSPVRVVDAIFSIIDKYPIHNSATKSKTSELLKSKEITPKVILSLTYC